MIALTGKLGGITFLQWLFYLGSTIFGLYSVILAVDISVSYSQYVTSYLPLLFFGFILTFYGNKFKKNEVFITIQTSLILLSCYFLYFNLTGNSTIIYNLQDKNELSFFFILGIIINRYNTNSWFLYLLFTMAALLTLSRTALICSLLLTYFLYGFQRLVVVMSICTPLILLFMSDIMLSVISRLQENESYDATNTNRLSIAVRGLSAWYEKSYVNILFGVGHNNWRVITGQRFGDHLAFAPHNTILAVLVQTGIFGMALRIIFLFEVFTRRVNKFTLSLFITYLLYASLLDLSGRRWIYYIVVLAYTFDNEKFKKSTLGS